MNAQSQRETAHRKMFKAIGDFLALHGLEPTPENYTLVYGLVSDDTTPVARMILALTADGVRLTQRDVDRIRKQIDEEFPGLEEDKAAELIADLRRSMENFTSVVEATREEARSYEADLARGAEDLNEHALGNPSIATVARLTGAMLERTRAAEAQLAVARSEADALRTKLAEAEEQARSDALTRLPNRRAFETRLEQVMGSGEVCSIAICDIDRFKRINDGHGHGVGDRVLRMVAESLQESCAEHMVARLGGEEFAILFQGLGPADAGTLLDQARADLAARDFRVRGTDAPLGQVTFSAGVARCTGDSPLKRADNLLYEAKDSGRNKVVAEAD
ncbi:MAG TPA: GGDEF domain-containing protein [Allosphingosinicella sp.]